MDLSIMVGCKILGEFWRSLTEVRLTSCQFLSGSSVLPSAHLAPRGPLESMLGRE